MERTNSLLMELMKNAPNAILQISVGDLYSFAGELISGVIDALNKSHARKTAEQLLTTDEVADILKVSKMTLHRWNKRGILPKIEIGSKRRYRRADIEAFIEKSREEGNHARK